MSTNNVFEIRSLLQNAQSVLIALAESNDEDVVAAGLGLYLTLGRMRKQATIVSAQKVKVELSHLVGIDKIADKMAGGDSLVISLPYEEGTIEKVSYHIDNDRFNLVIDPRGEKLDFDPKQVEYHYGRGDYDVVFVLGARNVSALGDIYNRHKNVFTQKPLVNIDKSENNTQFGKVNIVDDAPVSHSIGTLMKDLRLPLDQDAASNLYTGIISEYGSATIGELNPQTLDMLSFLGRQKAQNLKKSSGKRQKKQEEPEEKSTEKDTAKNNHQPAEKEDAPEDWLKPKIFTTNKQGGN